MSEYPYNKPQRYSYNAGAMKMNMKISSRVKERIARIIGEHFTTKEITTIFKDLGIETDEDLYAKWRITLDAFSKLWQPDTDLKNAIEEFCHPLCFQDQVQREGFIQRLNDVLSYDELEITYTDKNATLGPVKPKVSKGSSVPKNVRAEDIPDVDKCSISEKCIDLIADAIPLNQTDQVKAVEPELKKIKYLYSHNVIQDFIDKESPFTFFGLKDVLQLIRTKDIHADRHIEEILTALLQPIYYEPDIEIVDQVAGTINRYLSYDQLSFAKDGRKYLIKSIETPVRFESPKEVVMAIVEEVATDQPKLKANKELLVTLRDCHQTYIDVLETFCGNLEKPDPLLNDAYVKLAGRISGMIDRLNLKYANIAFYKPFSDLFSAEHDWKNSDEFVMTKVPPLTWDTIRPKLYKAHSDITKLISSIEETTDLSNDEAMLEEINTLVASYRTDEEPNDVPAIRLIHENADTKTTQTKAKKLSTYPKTIPAGTQWGNITMQFLDDESVEIRVAGTVHHTGYADMGFADNRKTGQPPNIQWTFLKELAKNNGSMKASDGNASNNYKQHKLRLSKRLMEYFTLDTDPFREYSTQDGYELKMTIFYNTEHNKQSDTQQQPSLSDEVDDMFSELPR